MTTKQDKKNTPLFPGMKFGTQERTTELNNGGAMQIVLNRRMRKSTGNKYKPASSNVNKDS